MNSETTRALIDPESAGVAGPEAGMAGITAVERDTGLAKDTLRVWERRYGFPKPVRDRFGERAYPREQVEKLRVLKRLIDGGQRPGKIIQYSLGELLARIRKEDNQGGPSPLDPALAAKIDLLRAHRVDELRDELGQALARAGLQRFVIEVAGPLNVAVGEAWMRGDVQIFEEHLYSECMQMILRGAIAGLPRVQGGPCVLMSTFPLESHGLGLLMAEALFVLEGAHCVPLGVCTPVVEIARAARAQGADIVALSFSLGAPATPTIEGLRALREQLPESTEIWAGGASVALGRLPSGEVRVLRELAAIGAALAAWRARRQG